MADRSISTVTRTLVVSDLTPVEMAIIFAAWDDTQQAEFFDALAAEARDWPGLGWNLQWLHVVGKLSNDGRRVVADLCDAARTVL